MKRFATGHEARRWSSTSGCRSPCKDNPDPKPQADLAEAYYRVGDITGMVGSMGMGAGRRRALTIRERLAAAYPANDDYRRGLATACLLPEGSKHP